MKKVININFKGRVIPIEEAAFEQLQQYISSLRRYFANEEGHDEIINDIEDRIAELFNEELKKGATCVTEESVNTILNSMGRVQDFEQMDAETGNGSAGNSNSGTSAAPAAVATDEPRGSMYRSANDKIIGGVCGGIAHYLKIDPAVVRILFALITFGGFGTGLLIYIILWIVLPARLLKSNIRKRLYRNPDEKVVGGVASGLAAYFNIPVWIPRLVFAMPFVLGIISSIFRHAFFFDFDIEPVFITGGFGGTLFITYVIMWIVIPMANTATEKLQMRGEKIDVNSIKNAVQEELGGVKERMSDLGQQVKQGAERMGSEAKEAAQRFSSQATPVATSVGSGIGNAIGILFKAFFLFIAGIIAFALLMALIGITIGGAAVFPLKDFFFEGGGQNLALWGTIILFLLVPIVGVIVWVIRKISGAKSRNPYLGYTFGTLWTLGWVAVVFLVASITKGFRYGGYVEESIPVTAPANGKMLITVTEPSIRYSGTYTWLENDGDGFDITEDTLRYSNVRVRIERSNDSSYSAKLYRFSFGNSGKSAKEKAEKIKFNYNYNNGVLGLGSGLAIDRASKFRGQKVMVVIKVPVGKKIRFDESVARRLHAFNIHINDGRRWNQYNEDIDFDSDDYFNYDTNVDYIMTEDGLRKLDRNGNIVEQKRSDWNDDEGKIKEDTIKPEQPNSPDSPQRYRYQTPKQDKPATTPTTKQIVENTDAPYLRPITVSAL